MTLVGDRMSVTTYEGSEYNYPFGYVNFDVVRIFSGANHRCEPAPKSLGLNDDSSFVIFWNPGTRTVQDNIE